MRRLIIDETSVYEIDEECMRQKQKKELAKAEMSPEQDNGSRIRKAVKKGSIPWPFR